MYSRLNLIMKKYNSEQKINIKTDTKTRKTMNSHIAFSPHPLTSDISPCIFLLRKLFLIA